LFIEMARYRLPPEEYEVKMFGGGNMFPNSLGTDGADVGTRNIESGRRLLNRCARPPAPTCNG
jgi:chemotaxis protein CheD